MTNETGAGEAGAGGKRDGRILVVDHSAVVRAVVARMLRTVGYTVLEAADAAQALGLIGRTPFDVVVADLRMPETDGFAVLEGVKRQGLDTEVVVLTGTHAKDLCSAVRALRLGAHDFLVTPPQGPHEVIVTVDRAVEKRHLKAANLRLLRDIEGMSRTDALTGVWNRRAFEETLERELHRASLHDLPLSLVLLDLDHFARVNDTQGRGVGDDVLRWIGVHLSQVLREGDTIHRYGGDEFAVVLPHTHLDGALHAARRLLAHLAASSFRDSLTLSASAGVASGQGALLESLNLVNVADTALVRAKRAGRNRAVAGDTGAPQDVPRALAN